MIIMKKKLIEELIKILTDVIEDICFAKAIRNGRNSEIVSEQEIMRIIDN